MSITLGARRLAVATALSSLALWLFGIGAALLRVNKVPRVFHGWGAVLVDVEPGPLLFSWVLAGTDSSVGPAS